VTCYDAGVRALCAAVLLFALDASAQECVTCRSGRCSGMFWIEPCGKPVHPKKARPVEPDGAVRARPKLEVDFPARVTEGDLLGIRIRSSARAWLIVYYLDDHKAGAVLWPSALEPAPWVDAQHPASLVSPRESQAGQTLVAQLSRPGTPAHETFIVYALTEQADFERLKPKPDQPLAEGAAYAAGLVRQIAALPKERWAQFRADYTIEPKR
jgi:hypothetical protein